MRVRCSKCQKRARPFVLRFWKCKCGHTSCYVIKDQICTCDGYHFPHRKGSRYCVTNKENLTDDDLEDRYKVIPQT